MLIGSLAGLALVTSGCTSHASVGVSSAGYYDDGYYDGYYDGYVWVDGRWVWGATGWVWYPGYYVQARPGYMYVQGYWDYGAGYWNYRPGRWVHSRHGYRYVTPRYDRRTGRVIRRGGWRSVRDNRGHTPAVRDNRSRTPTRSRAPSGWSGPRSAPPPSRSRGPIRDHRSGGGRTRDHRR